MIAECFAELADDMNRELDRACGLALDKTGLDRVNVFLDELQLYGRIGTYWLCCLLNVPESVVVAALDAHPCYIELDESGEYLRVLDNPPHGKGESWLV